MSDLVKRLRADASGFIGPRIGPWIEPEEVFAAAADEIERLRAALEDIAGHDCTRYHKVLATEPCGVCFPCQARLALDSKK